MFSFSIILCLLRQLHFLEYEVIHDAGLVTLVAQGALFPMCISCGYLLQPASANCMGACGYGLGGVGWQCLLWM